MQRQAVKSSAIKSIGHDAEKHILEVEFHSGGIYQYRDFTPEHFATFQSAKSIGGHFAKHIQGKHPMMKLEVENAAKTPKAEK
jgi:hypothetical protein